MTTTTTPLLVVDMQNGFINTKSEHVLPAVRALIESWQCRGAPVYFSRFINDPGSQWESLIGWNRLRARPETDLHPALSDLASKAIVFEKHSYSCLVGPFADALKSEAWNEVVLCGVATDGCVLKTAIDLFEYKSRAVRPVVVTDACASHAGQEVHEAGLLLLSRFIGKGQLVTSADVHLWSTLETTD